MEYHFYILRRDIYRRNELQQVFEIIFLCTYDFQEIR